jgi:hypothetical protein
MSSTVVAKNLQVGADGTASNNFTIYQPASPDGTLRIGNGNTGTTSAQVVLTSAGNVGIGTSSPTRKLEVSGAPSSVGADGTGVLVTVVNTSTAFNASPTSAISLWNRINSGGSTFPSAVVQAGKENATDGNFAGYLSLQTTSSVGNSTERARIDSAGNVGIGTSSPLTNLHVRVSALSGYTSVANSGLLIERGNGPAALNIASPNNQSGFIWFADQDGAGPGNIKYDHANNSLSFAANDSERMRIASNGDVLVGKTASGTSNVGGQIQFGGQGGFTTNQDTCIITNRQGNDGELVRFQQANSTEGSISVSGTTVSYNGGHLSRWAQTTTPKDESLVKGTVLSNLDEMNVYTDAEGNPVENEQLNKVKVSDVEGDVNVAGVFVNWEHDDQHNVDEINMAMTGDMIIRIAQGVTVQRGDLLMSAGDGTAKPQGDDIVRSKTIAKVTSTHVTCTYADGSFCVPCVLMAC